MQMPGGTSICRTTSKIATIRTVMRRQPKNGIPGAIIGTCMRQVNQTKYYRQRFLPA
jgi:hypothetical protein